jgi:hypothetical protein
MRMTVVIICERLFGVVLFCVSNTKNNVAIKLDYKTTPICSIIPFVPNQNPK